MVPRVTTWRVGRRYRDFDKLNEQLGMEGHKHSVLPALPPKRSLRLSRNTAEEHAESRRRALQFWLRHLVSHPAFKAADPLKIFPTSEGRRGVSYGRVSMNKVKSIDWVVGEMFMERVGRRR